MDKKIYVTKPTPVEVETIKSMVGDVWASGQYTNGGQFHQNLEKALSETLKAPYFSLFNNGTIALMIAIKALDLKGEVIVTPFTFPATVTSIDWCGLTPVFCDIDPDTMCIDPAKIESLITDKTSAIMGVHVYGIPCDVDAIQKIADKHNLKVIYDAAHAFLSHIDGKPISDFGDASMFSFHATKIFQTLEGGGISFKHESVKKKAELLKNFGLVDGIANSSGINAKMNEVQAAVGLATLDVLKEEKQKRQKVSDAYDDFFKDIDGIETFSSLSNSLQYYPIRVNKKKFGMSRDGIRDELEKQGIFARKYFYPLCSDIEDFKNHPSAKRENLPVASEVTENVLCLPFYGDLLGEDLGRILSCLESLK